MVTNFREGIASMGIPVVGGSVPAMFGNVYWVDYNIGVDGNDGKTKEKPLKKLSTAYDKVTTNNNDIILINGYSTVQEDEKITWAKNRVHVIGLGGGYYTGQRTKLALSTTGNAADTSCTLQVTGVGNTFHNLKIMNSGTHASSIGAVIDEGEANVFYNCSIMKFTDLDQTTVADLVLRSDSTAYLNCEFGFDTLVQSVARPTVRIKNSGATRCKHLVMKDCLFSCASSDSDKAFILIEDSSSLAFSNYIINPIFNAAIVGSLSAATLDNSIDSASGLSEGNVLVVNPAFNTTKLATTLNAGVTVVGPAPDATAGEAQTPS